LNYQRPIPENRADANQVQTISGMALCLYPVSLALRYVPGWRNETALFICSGARDIPLAGLMVRLRSICRKSSGQRSVAYSMPPSVNAAELIIALLALHKGLFGVVKASLTRIDSRQYSAGLWRFRAWRAV